MHHHHHHQMRDRVLYFTLVWGLETTGAWRDEDEDGKEEQEEIELTDSFRTRGWLVKDLQPSELIDVPILNT
jgi:hypothetical protein